MLQREAETRALNGPLGLTIERWKMCLLQGSLDSSPGFGVTSFDELGVGPCEASFQTDQLATYLAV